MRWLLILLACGCGRVGFDGRGGSGDSDGGGDGAIGDGGTDGAMVDGATSPLCGSTVLLGDDFEDGTRGAIWTGINTGTYTVGEPAGELRVDFAATEAGNTRAGYRQTAVIDLTGTCAIAEVLSMPTGAAYGYVRLGGPTQNVEVYVGAGGLVGGRFRNGGTAGTLGGAGWDPVAHRFIRVRQAANAYHMEAGPSIDSFPTMVGSAGGALVMPSPSSFEVGGTTQGTVVMNGGSARFASVLLLGP